MTNSDPQSRSEPQTWTAVGFLDEFMRIHETMEDRSFAFILGAGASVTSEIPTGATLARRWVEELYTFSVGDNAETSIENWATQENLEIPGFTLDDAASFYPDVYDRRFGDDPDRGYAYLEHVMSKAEPNIGYSILAQVLEKTRHKVIITTNFDNLVADALSIYTNTFPLVCGHESLTGFVRLKLGRPLVAKIHRDLLLAPRNDPAAISQLPEEWARVLRRLLDEYTPVVLGYGGNDGSLMGFLKRLEPGSIQGGIFWCYRRADGLPNDRIRSLVAKHKGRLIPIVGFDEFMIQLGGRLKYKPLAGQIGEQARKRAKRYREQFQLFQKNLARPAKDAEAEKAAKPVREALAATVQRLDDWWAWELKAQGEPDPDKREQIYRKGLEQFPSSAELVGYFALFMDEVRKNYGEAERWYRHAVELAPLDAEYPGNLAVFLDDVRKDYDKAEHFYLLALKLDAKHASNTGNFASFRWLVRKDYDDAERLYRRALELGPDNATNTGNLALFMHKVRKDYDEAERLYRRALELDPDDANNTGTFAILMWHVRGEHDEGERLYRRALKLDPDNPTNTGNFAYFMWHVRNDYDEAERLYRRALELDPDDASNTGNFAGFLLARGHLEETREMLSQAWALNKAEVCQLAAELALYWCLVARLEDQDDAPGLARLKSLFVQGFEREYWTFHQVIATATKKLSPDEFEFYSALADAILDAAKVADLDQFDRWKEVEPIPIDEPWEMWE